MSKDYSRDGRRIPASRVRHVRNVLQTRGFAATEQQAAHVAFDLSLDGARPETTDDQVEQAANAILETGYCPRLCAGDHNTETCFECAKIEAQAALEAARNDA